MDDVKIYKDKIDVALIPGLAFNQKRFRLGYGGGFYDKLLAEKKIGLTIGCFFAWQFCESFRLEKHDAVLDVIITDKKRYV